MSNLVRFCNLTARAMTDRVRVLFKEGLSKSEIARQLNIGRTSVRRILNNECISAVEIEIKNNNGVGNYT